MCFGTVSLSIHIRDRIFNLLLQSLILRTVKIFIYFSTEKHMTLVDNVNEMKKMFVGIGLDDVRATGLDFFDIPQSKIITDYIYSR